ncbi:hypothetical protein E3N88_28549 [Mikania micrantha]|uniref:Integrase catalytic domain-containing protein n=1 Tax=Mikania micrantha TaxID=192012 RepID=A0A5N6N033_9ASTR|nr:hypothetical protein E3N88_28549 [Mikania micrantha]
MADKEAPPNQMATVDRSINIPFQCPILTDTNYTIWSLRIKAIFKAHGIWDAIEPGTTVVPKKDNAAIALLYQALPEDLVIQVAYCERAAEIWQAIKTRHVGVERVMEARLQTLNVEFAAAKMKDGEKIDDFATKLSGFASRSASLGKPIEETNLEVIGRLKAYEERTKNTKPNHDQMMLSYEEWDQKRKQAKNLGRGRGIGQETRGRGRGRGHTGGRGRGMGHGQTSREGAQEPEKKDRSKIQCFRCDAFGHYSADCPTRQNEEKVTLSQANADGPALLMTVAEQDKRELIYVNEDKVLPANYGSHNDGEFVLYLDTGVTNHMTGNRKLFSVLDTSVRGEVRFEDNSCVEIEVLGKPRKKCEISIKDGVLAIFEQDGTLLMKTSRSPNRLYRINLKIGSPICLLAKAGDVAWLWHARLGHVNFDTIKRLGAGNLVQGVPPIEHPSQLCEACLAGKHTRQSFPSQSSFRSKTPLEQVYGDLCGPITPATNARNRNILLIVDDHSQFMWPYMLKTKDEALEKFKIFKARVENQYGKKIKVLRTDWGGEFTSKDFNTFCEHSWITRQLTAPYTPQQNGIVERRNRTVMSTTRSILNAMRMPQELWAEADWSKEQDQNHSKQVDFVLHSDPPYEDRSTHGSEEDEHSSPVRSQLGSPVHRDSPPSTSENTSSPNGSTFSSPESTIAGCGPMLPESATRVYGDSDPFIAEVKIRHAGIDQVQKARLQTIKTEFDRMQMKEDETIDSFTARLSSIVSRATNCDFTFDQQTIVRRLLNSVPNRFIQIVASIEQFTNLDTMTLDETIGKLKTFEERIKSRRANISGNHDKLLLTKHDNKTGQRRQFGNHGQKKFNPSQKK